MPSVTVFRPSTSVGTLYGGATTLFSFVVAALLLFRGVDGDTRFGQIYPLTGSGLFFALGSLYLYWTWGCATLRYTIDRNALSIRWGNVRQVIPLDRIERLVPGEDAEAPHVEGVSWVGHHVGRAQVEPMGAVLFYSAHRMMREVVYVLTSHQAYAISVPDQQQFVQSIQQAQTRGPLFDERQAVHRWGLAAQSFWLDPQARLLALALIASFLVVLGYVLHQYPGLPQTIPLRFPSLGGIVRVGDRSDLLDIPRSGLGFLAVNLTLAVVLHSWERMVGYVLLLAGIAVQVSLLVAAAVAVA